MWFKREIVSRPCPHQPTRCFQTLNLYYKIKNVCRFSLDPHLCQKKYLVRWIMQFQETLLYKTTKHYKMQMDAKSQHGCFIQVAYRALNHHISWNYWKKCWKLGHYFIKWSRYVFGHFLGWCVVACLPIRLQQFVKSGNSGSRLNSSVKVSSSIWK